MSILCDEASVAKTVKQNPNMGPETGESTGPNSARALSDFQTRLNAAREKRQQVLADRGGERPGFGQIAAALKAQSAASGDLDAEGFDPTPPHEDMQDDSAENSAAASNAQTSVQTVKKTSEEKTSKAEATSGSAKGAKTAPAAPKRARRGASALPELASQEELVAQSMRVSGASGSGKYVLGGIAAVAALAAMLFGASQVPYVSNNVLASAPLEPGPTVAEDILPALAQPASDLPETVLTTASATAVAPVRISPVTALASTTPENQLVVDGVSAAQKVWTVDAGQSARPSGTGLFSNAATDSAAAGTELVSSLKEPDTLNVEIKPANDVSPILSGLFPSANSSLDDKTFLFGTQSGS
jgi:fermentation-respiration switch protein FrsA (DUF1100 family)